MANSGPSCALGILLVDDEPDLYPAIAEALRDAGHEVHTALDGEQALKAMSSRHVDVMLTDIRLRGLDGLSLLRLARQRSPATIVILVTELAEAHEAMSAVREGAHDYLTKPLRCDDIARRIERIAAQVSMQRQRARMPPARWDMSEQIVGCSTIMSRLMDRLCTIAASDVPVLLLGETGTGKELVARALHERSPRHGKPFVAVSSASFTNDSFVAARGGTVLLDEVGDMSPAAQIRLLGVLDDHSVDVRVMSATRRDLVKMTESGRFREDLYRRLSVLSIVLPPLRARHGDLALLAQYFLNKFHRPGNGPARMSSTAWSALAAFGFPGNVRQLGSVIEHATVLAAGGEIELRHLPAEIRAPLAGFEMAFPAPGTLEVAKKGFELEYIRQVSQHSEASRAEATNILATSRGNLCETWRDDEDAA